MGKKGFYHKGILVPGNYKNELQTDSLETREAIVKKVILESGGETLKSSDIAVALGMRRESTYIIKIIADLIKKGRVTKVRAKNAGKGHHFIYYWHDTPVSEDKPILGTGAAAAARLKPDWPQFPIDPKQLDKLDGIFHKWIDDGIDFPSGEEIVGARKFRLFVQRECAKVEQRRIELENNKEAK